MKSFTNIIIFYISTLKIYFIRVFNKFTIFSISFLLFIEINLKQFHVNIITFKNGTAKITSAIIKSNTVILFSNINDIINRIKAIE